MPDIGVPPHNATLCMLGSVPSPRVPLPLRGGRYLLTYLHLNTSLIVRAAVAAGYRRRFSWCSLARAPASCRVPAAREGCSRPSAQGAAAASGQRCSCGGASAASTGRGGVSSFELGSADRMPSAVTAICASPGSPPLERAARRGRRGGRRRAIRGSPACCTCAPTPRPARAPAH